MLLQEAMVLSGKIIMVVEDDRTSRRLVSAILQRQGALCLEAEDGQEAISLLATRHCDLIITDLRMPVMDGVELIKTVRECEKKSGDPRIPVVILSTEKGDMFDAAIKLGVSGHLIKSDAVHKLVPELQQLLAD
jgi:CheY-like chemotaxis protein